MGASLNMDFFFFPPRGFSQLLLLLSHFSRVQLCATPYTAAHQALPSLGFSRQEHWGGLPFPSPMHESEVTQSCTTLRDPVDYSLPGSSIHGIFQARSHSFSVQSAIRLWNNSHLLAFIPRPHPKTVNLIESQGHRHPMQRWCWRFHLITKN